jgi:hypothetical protein
MQFEVSFLLEGEEGGGREYFMSTKAERGKCRTIWLDMMVSFFIFIDALLLVIFFLG